MLMYRAYDLLRLCRTCDSHASSSDLTFPAFEHREPSNRTGREIMCAAVLVVLESWRSVFQLYAEKRGHMESSTQSMVGGSEPCEWKVVPQAGGPGGEA